MMAPPPHILIAGIGNIFLGDDAFGCEVARRLASRPQPEHVRIVDFGIRGLDLIYALQDGCDAVILLDAAPRGEGAPGTLYLLEPLLGGNAAPAPIDPHALDPVTVLRAAAAMGATPGHVYVVGCEPATHARDFDEGDLPGGLSAAVAEAVDRAVELVEQVIGRIRGEHAADCTADTQKEAGACP